MPSEGIITTDNGKMSKKKKTTPTDLLRARAQSRPFIDGFDSYRAEYEFWKSLGLVRGLLGILELSSQDMVEKDTSQLLAELGFGEHEHLTHLIQVDNSERSTDRTTGGGWTSATRDSFGKIRPFIFVQKEVGDPKLGGEEEAVYKLLILLHELGHAKDIVDQTNYNHEELTLDIVEAEIYAHRFVLQHLRRMGYRLLAAQKKVFSNVASRSRQWDTRNRPQKAIWSSQKEIIQQSKPESVFAIPSN